MTEVIDPTCPNCGAKLQTDRSAAQVQCAHCGTELVIERKAMAVAPAAEPYKCPKCGKADRVQKVSSVYTSGISRGYYDGYWGHSQTDLSKLLAPPPEPSGAHWGQCLLGVVAYVLMLPAGLGILLSLVALFFSLADPGNLGAFGPALGLLLLSVGVIAAIMVVIQFVTRPHKREVAAKKERWKRAVGEWNRLYYCARDDGVFVPGESAFIPIDKMQEFLYRD